MRHERETKRDLPSFLSKGPKTVLSPGLAFSASFTRILFSSSGSSFILFYVHFVSFSPVVFFSFTLMDPSSFTPGSRMTSSQYGISSPPPFSDRKLSSSELHHNHHYEYVSMDASSSSSSLSPSMKLERSFSATPTPDSQMRCNKRSKFSPYGLNGSHHHNHPPVAARRNERERNRVKLVNMGFSTLRQHVPNGAKNKKMSKVETLRSAVDYIRQLQQLLGEG